MHFSNYDNLFNAKLSFINRTNSKFSIQSKKLLNFDFNGLNMKVSNLAPHELPTALAHAMKVKTTPRLDWELCGKLIEKEKINLVRSYSRWTAFYVGPRIDSKEAEQTADTAIEAIVKCYIEKKLGNEI